MPIRAPLTRQAAAAQPTRGLAEQAARGCPRIRFSDCVAACEKHPAQTRPASVGAHRSPSGSPPVFVAKVANADALASNSPSRLDASTYHCAETQGQTGRESVDGGRDAREHNPADESAPPPSPCGGDWRDPACFLAALRTTDAPHPASVEASRGLTAHLPALDMLLQRLVRRVAWAGDGRAGTVRLELGAGELEGTTVVVHAEGGEVSVDVELSPGLDTQTWHRRIGDRLSASGLLVRELVVR